MEITTKSFETKNGLVEGAHIKWTGFSILMVTGRKGFLVCGVFDLEAIERFNAAAAMVESAPDNPIGTLDRFPNRKIMRVNARAQALGITVGMEVQKAFEAIA